MKRLLLSILLLIAFFPVFAKHVTGGEVIYDYVGPGGSPGTKIYNITLRLFRDENTVGGANLPASVGMGIYNNDNNTLVNGYVTVPQSLNNHIPIFTPPTCITNPPALDYTAGYYTFTVTLPDNANGYTIAYQTCCRIDGINNTNDGVGSTYIGSIPGLNTLPTGFDNSARFQTGINIICYQKPFTLDFSATDPDGDSLVYSTIEAYDGGPANTSTCSGCPAAFASPAAPPYPVIPYLAPYSGLQPFGPGASINTATGIISGIAPAPGKYVVAVMVKSYRNGHYVTEHRKDFIITVAPCEIPSAQLDPVYTFCDAATGFETHFHNNATSVLNVTFFWDFGDPASGANNTSTSEFPTHIYSAAGDYNLTLVVNQGTPCEKTAHAIVKVYPGFFPAFAPIPAMCKDLPVQFNDATTATYGAPNYWRWDFGDLAVTNDTSHLQNPVYTYHTAGVYNVEFIVETDKGCRDTLYPKVTIVDKPDFHITKDTLICVVDTLQLHSNVTTGTITWSPNYMISDIHSFNPLISPDVTTPYTANYTDPAGCTATAQVKVTVVNDVTLLSIDDTTICRSDSAILHINTDALYFTWTPPDKILDPTVKDPKVFTLDPLTIFHVKASISDKCFKEKDIRVKTVPYPVAAITGSDRICYGKNDTLHATGGSSYVWSPPAYLNNPFSPDPISIAPKATITYTVTVTDVLGCPKPVSTTFTVNVIRLFADAGPKDTSVVLGQPLQLAATGGTFYHWTPGTYLDDPGIRTPISHPQNNITYAVEVSNDIGCLSSDTINVHVFFLEPGLYVPSAFTPGRDNLNDVFRPIALGIRTLEYFRVYDRWGVLLYQTSRIGDGWDGTYKGAKQDPAAYVWEASAIDYQGKKIFRKGSVILIR